MVGAGLRRLDRGRCMQERALCPRGSTSCRWSGTEGRPHIRRTSVSSLVLLLRLYPVRLHREAAARDDPRNGVKGTACTGCRAQPSISTRFPYIHIGIAISQLRRAG